jgi:putative transposase
MPREPRHQAVGGIYHITARGNRRQLIFEDDRDRIQFLDLFARISRALSWICHGYCLMANHYHVVVETPEPNLSSGMHRLNSGYAHWFNWRHGVDGHLFQGRFHAVFIESNWHLIELSRYLALNPVRGQLCKRPSAWQWGSYRFLAGAVDLPPPFLAVDRVLGYFGTHRETARETFAQYVEAGL